MIRVMLVEDEPPILRMLAKMIAQCDCDFEVCHTAKNGADALAFARAEAVDIIFTDIRMPVMDGLALMEAAQRERPDTILVVLSGYREFEYAKQAIRFGVFDYLLKPVSVDAMRGTLMRLKEECRRRRQPLLSEAQMGDADTDAQRASEVVEKVKQYLERSYRSPVTGEELSRQFGFVPSYISRIFRQSYGVSPSEFVTQLRIDEAKRLLRKEPAILIKDIAFRVGFKDQYHFSKTFKKKEGIWPTDYRR